MTRKPIVGSDRNIWGTILNDNLDRHDARISTYHVMDATSGPVAVGNGVTDDWDAIQTRLNNLPTTPDSARGGKIRCDPLVIRNSGSVTVEAAYVTMQVI